MAKPAGLAGVSSISWLLATTQETSGNESVVISPTASYARAQLRGHPYIEIQELRRDGMEVLCGDRLVSA